MRGGEEEVGGVRDGGRWVLFIALTLSVEPGLRRSSSRHRTTPSFRELCRKASGSEMVFLGDSSTPSVINHVTVCSAEFMSQSRQILFNKSGGVFCTASPPPLSLPLWLGCHHLRVRSELNPQKSLMRCRWER